MNKQQYSIVETFIKMGNKPTVIAKKFKADLLDVLDVASSHNYEHYVAKKNGQGKNFYEDLLKGMSF